MISAAHIGIWQSSQIGLDSVSKTVRPALGSPDIPIYPAVAFRIAVLIKDRSPFRALRPEDCSEIVALVFI
jgi:hypothetical protein